MPVPVNDLCVNATVIAALPFSVVGLDLTSATTSADDPLLGYIGSGVYNPGDTAVFQTVWYKWTAPSALTVRLTTTNFVAIGVLTGSCGTLTEVVSYQPSVVFTAVAGTTYYIMLGPQAAGPVTTDFTMAVTTNYANQWEPTAQRITTLPFTVTLDNTRAPDSGTVWYRFVGTQTDELSAFAYPSTSTARIDTSTADNYYPLSYPAGVSAAISVPIQVPVVVGRSIYWAISVPATGTTAITIKAFSPQASATVIGDLLVPDDTDGFPFAILGGTDGTIRQFIYPATAGEGGDILPTGEVGVTDVTNNLFKVYNPTLQAVLASVAAPTVSSLRILSVRTNQLDTFYVGVPGIVSGGSTPARVQRIKANGTALSTLGPFPAVGLTGAAPNVAETILYITGQTSALNSPVQRWDIASNTALTDLAAAVTGYSIARPLLVLSDDTILVPYFKASAPLDTFVRQYSAAGAVLNTYAFPLNTLSDFQVARALDDPLSFLAWERRANGISQFSKIRISDGAVLTTFSQVQFEGGVYQSSRTATPAMFGHSESCPFLALRTVVPAPPSPPSGGPAACPTGLPLAPGSGTAACAADL